MNFVGFMSLKANGLLKMSLAGSFVSAFLNSRKCLPADSSENASLRSPLKTRKEKHPTGDYWRLFLEDLKKIDFKNLNQSIQFYEKTLKKKMLKHRSSFHVC